MNKKIALITGANKGIGYQTALQLGTMGITVLLGVRNEARGEDAVAELQKLKIDAHPLMLDPTDEYSVINAVKEVEKKFGGLDILVNNAGTMLDSDKLDPGEVTVDTMRETFELNVFGLHAVTHEFWVLLNKSSAARLVNVSSALGSLTLHSKKAFGDFKAIAYDSSKAAVNMMTVHYAAQWNGTAHKANCVHPGAVKTDLNPFGELTVEIGAKTSVRLATIGGDGPNGKFFHLDDELPW